MDRPQIRNSKVEFLLLVIVIRSTPSHNYFNSSIKGFNITLMFVPGWSGPGMMRHMNLYSYFMQRAGGRLYGIAKTCQQEYDAALVLYGQNPSIANPMRSLRQSHLEPSIPHYQTGASSLGHSHCTFLMPPHVSSGLL
jgi:hypothetical protein